MSVSFALRYGVLCLFLASFSFGCSDGDDKKSGGGKKSDNGVWLTYQDQSRALTQTVMTVNNNLLDEDVMFTVIGSGFNEKANQLGKDATAEDFFDAVHQATVRFSGTFKRGAALNGQVFPLGSKSSDNLITIDQDFEDVPGRLISTSGALTLTRIDFEKKELFEQNDPAYEWTSGIKIQRLEYTFDGEFAKFGDENQEGPRYALSGKVIYSK